MKTSIPDRIKIPAALWAALPVIGISVENVVQHARLPISVVREGNVTTAQYFAIWQAITELGGDMGGIRLASKLEAALMPASFVAASYAKDFCDALHRVARFKELCAPEKIEILEEGDSCVILFEWLHAGHSQQPDALVDATMASLIELGRRGTRHALAARQVDLKRSRADVSEREAYFGGCVRLEAQQNRLVLHREDVSRGFFTHNAELLEMLTPALTNALEQNRNCSSVRGQAAWVLRRRLSGGRPNVQDVAEALNMSERSFQRRLTEEGATFQQLLNQTRRELAREYLDDAAMDVNEVAFMLGYEDQNSFYRAFRVWEGTSPSVWRAGRPPANGQRMTVQH